MTTTGEEFVETIGIAEKPMWFVDNYNKFLLVSNTFLFVKGLNETLHMPIILYTC